MAVLIGSIFTVSLWSSAAFAEGTSTAGAATSGTAISTTNAAVSTTNTVSTTNAAVITTNAAVSTTSPAAVTTSTGITAGTGTSVSITPDNIFYSVKRLIENIQVALTFTPEGKAQLLVTLADERLAEADLMMEKNKQELVEQVMKACVETVADANEKLEEAAQSGTDVKATLDDIRIIEQTADKLVIRATGVIPAASVETLKTSVTDQVKATLALQAFAIAKADLRDANNGLKAADEALKAAEKGGDQTAIKTAEANQQAAQQAKLDAENVKNQVEAYKDEIVRALKDDADERSDEDREDGKEDGHKLSAEELQAKIAHLQAIIDKQQQKRAEQVAKHSGKPGKAAVMIDKNAKKQLAKAQARIDALKAQLGTAQAGSTSGSGISAGQNAIAGAASATSGAIAANTSIAKVTDEDGDKDDDKDNDKGQANIKNNDHSKVKAYGLAKDGNKDLEDRLNGDNDDEDKD